MAQAVVNGPSGDSMESGGLAAAALPPSGVAETSALDAPAISALTELESLYATAPVGLAVFDRNLRFIRINERLAQINGATVEAHIGRTVAEMVPDLTVQAQALLNRIVTAGEPVSGIEVVGETPAHPGRERTWIEYWNPVRDARGEIVGVSVVAEEVTELRMRERESREANAHKDEFLAILSHELRNPLVPLRNALWIIGSREVDATCRRAVDLATRQLQHLSVLVDDLLDVARISGGLIKLRPERVLVPQAIYTVVEALAATLDERGQHIEFDMPRTPLWVEADPIRLTQIIENLVSNASKYTDTGGTITVHAAIEADGIVIEVSDTGIGIAPENLTKIFAMFAQVHATEDRPAGGGLGVGLALVRKLVDAHGGWITASSDGLGKGSTFRVTLPGN